MKFLFGRDKGKPSYEQLEKRINDLENIVKHQKDRIRNRQKIAQEVKDACVQREVDALEHADKKQIDILVDYHENVRYVSPKYLRLSGYLKQEVIGKKYYKLLKGSQEQSNYFFESPEQLTADLIILGKPDEKNPHQYNEIHVQATKYPVFSFDEQIKGHRLRPHIFTRVFLKKKKVVKIKPPPKNKRTVKKVRDVIANANKEVEDMIARKEAEQKAKEKMYDEN